MSDKKVIGLVSKEQKMEDAYRQDLLATIDEFRKLVEDGTIKEFVISSADEYGEVIITACARDFLGALGLFEMGKHTLMMQKSFEE